MSSQIDDVLLGPFTEDVSRQKVSYRQVMRHHVAVDRAVAVQLEASDEKSTHHGQCVSRLG